VRQPRHIRAHVETIPPVTDPGETSLFNAINADYVFSVVYTSINVHKTLCCRSNRYDLLPQWPDIGPCRLVFSEG